MDIERQAHIEMIIQAERQYKFSVALSFDCHTAIRDTNRNYVNYSMEYVWGKYRYGEAEMRITPQEELTCSITLQLTSIYILVLQLDRFLEKYYGSNRFDSDDIDLANTSIVVRQIRNAFAHNPLYPTWEIRQPQAKNKIINIGSMLTVDFERIDGKKVEREHYGGPLAILELSKFVRGKFL
jgi:hypothetical protein